MYKRGQLTLFIILGILIVASVVLVYYFREQIFLSEFEQSRAESLIVPAEAQELHDSISTCVEETITEGLTLLGQQGGYIAIPDDPIGRGDHNPFSNSLEIFPGADFQTVYWFYEAANGVQHSQAPSRETMESELASYVSANLASCSSDFDLFTAYNASAGAIATDVEILEEQVLFTVYYPVHIALDDFVFDFEAFYLSEDVPLGSLYDAASEIMDTENTQYLLEDLSYDSMVLYDEVPLSWTEFDCSRESWEIAEVQESLQNIISQNVLAVKVRGTEYEVNTESDENYFEWNLLESAPNNLHVNLYSSPEWPFSMQVYPTEGSSLVEDTLTGSPATSFLAGLFCLTNYNFIYDIKYPVLVTLYDAESDYRFQFASMVILDNNQPRENREGLLELTPVETTICENAITPLTVEALEVADDGSLVTLNDALISFQCINNQCPLGKSRGVLNTLVPQCVNGQVIAEKDGYQRGVEIVTTLESEDVTVVLEKFVNLSYDIKLVDLEGNVRAPRSDEVLFVTLSEEATGYTTTVTYPYQSESILLIPGTYRIDGKLVSDVPFDVTVDPQSLTTCTAVPEISLGGLFGLGENTRCTDIETDTVEIQSALTGGVTARWDLDRSSLAGANHVRLYVTALGDPEALDEEEELLNYLDTGLGFKEPELS